MFTVWEFRSIDGKQIVRVVRKSEPMEQGFEHEYQRIIYRGTDHNEARRHAA